MIKTAPSFKSISLSLLSSVLLFTSAASPALAENWTLNGNDIYKNNSGNVGIGITVPITPLQVNLAINAVGAIRLSEGSTAATEFGDASSIGVNGIAALFSNGTEKIRLFADPTQNSWINAGNVGIGTDAPDSKLTVSGTTKLTGNPVSTPILTVDSWADGKYSAIVKGPNPGFAIQNIYDPAPSGLYKFVSGGNSLMLHQNTAAAGDFSTSNNLMTWAAGGNVGIGGAPGSYKLDVAGTAKISGAVGINGPVPGAVIGGFATGLAVSGYTGLGGLRVNGADKTNTIYKDSEDLGISSDAAMGGRVMLGDTNAKVLNVGGGNVGIGTLPPAYPYKLQVAGGDVKFNGGLEVDFNANMTGNLTVAGSSTLNTVTTQSTLIANGLLTVANGGAWVTVGNLSTNNNDGTVTTASITSTGWKTHSVTFPVAWSSVPTVIVTRKVGGTGVMDTPEILVDSVTTTGFVIKFYVSARTTSGTIQFNWMAL